MTPLPRVLHVGKYYPPVSGGMEKVLQVVCEAERDAVDGQVLVANDRRGTVLETVNGVRVTRVTSWRKIGAVSVCPTFPLWLRRMKADVIVIHEPNPLALLAHALVRPKGNVVFWIHAEVVRPHWQYRAFYRPFLTRMLGLADRIVVASPPMLDHAVELQPYRGKCTVIPYAIDPDQHALTDTMRTRVHAIRSAKPEPLALFVGRMVPYKGVDVFLRALVDTRARAVLVGEGPLRSAWQQLATALGVGDRVQFVGEAPASELAALYNACDFFVLPSVTRAEAFGMVQLEAMACGKPVISTALPSGVPWVNQHEVTGLVVPPGNVAALSAAITRLSGDAALRDTLGRGGRARVVTEFSIARLREHTTALYRALLDTPKHDTASGTEAA